MWLFVLYGLAAVWALQTLLKLMLRHKESHLVKLKGQQQREQAEQAILEAIDQKNRELTAEQVGSRAA